MDSVYKVDIDPNKLDNERDLFKFDESALANNNNLNIHAGAVPASLYHRSTHENPQTWTDVYMGRNEDFAVPLGGSIPINFGDPAQSSTANYQDFSYEGISGQKANWTPGYMRKKNREDQIVIEDEYHVSPGRNRSSSSTAPGGDPMDVLGLFAQCYNTGLEELNNETMPRARPPSITHAFEQRYEDLPPLDVDFTTFVLSAKMKLVDHNRDILNLNEYTCGLYESRKFESIVNGFSNPNNPQTAVELVYFNSVVQVFDKATKPHAVFEELEMREEWKLDWNMQTVEIKMKNTSYVWAVEFSLDIVASLHDSSFMSVTVGVDEGFESSDREVFVEDLKEAFGGVMRRFRKFWGKEFADEEPSPANRGPKAHGSSAARASQGTNKRPRVRSAEEEEMMNLQLQFADGLSTSK